MALNATGRRISAKIAEWRAHPPVFAREVFGMTPDPWQDNVLAAFPHSQRQALIACKGPGKTALLAIIAWNFLATRPKANIAATSISGDNLRDGLWKEMAKWHAKSDLLQAWFQWTSTRIFAKEAPADWWMSARTWPRQASPDMQAQTLAGLHADYVMFLLDECGSIPHAVMATAEAALSGCIEGHLVIAGNPTNVGGPLYDAATKDKDLWSPVHITGDPDDPNRTSRMPVEWAQQQIKKWGREHPFVKVNVFGEFPPQSLTALIGPDEVRAAMRRFYRPHEIGKQPKILGVDVAREGDDLSSISRRHGPQMFPFLRYRNVPDGIAGASILLRAWNEFDADAAFVDATGGLGFTWIDQAKVLGKSPVGVKFSSKASAEDRYANKRAEMYFRLIEWIRNGGALPPEDADGSSELLRALTETNYTFYKDLMILEDKDDIKAKLGFSPDDADAAALTFAEPVTPLNKGFGQQNRAISAVNPNYDPFSEMNQIGGMGRSVVQEYDPWRP